VLGLSVGSNVHAWAPYPGFAVEVGAPGEGPPSTCEGEKRQGHRNGNVDSDLAHVNFVLELSRRAARAREDGGAVPVHVGVDQRDGSVLRAGFTRACTRFCPARLVRLRCTGGSVWSVGLVTDGTVWSGDRWNSLVR